MDQTKQNEDRITITLPAGLRHLVDNHRRQLEQSAGVRLSLAQAAAALVRKGAEAAPVK